MTDLILHRDQAYSPREWAELLKDRERSRRYSATYRAAHPEQSRAYNRAWMKAKRERDHLARPVLASLHELHCTGPHHGHKRCRPILLYGAR